MVLKDLQSFLDEQYHKYHQKDFIPHDPIQIPLSYSLKQDQEISGLFASILAWGQRKTIISKTKEILARMDDAPFEFITNHSETDLKRLIGFKHRTFNDVDLLYFIHFLKDVYKNHNSLEDFLFEENETVFEALVHFKKAFETHEHYPSRSGKHLSSPLKGSACKRLNMYFRWMVRNDGIDLGIWNKLETKDLIIPLDVHVIRVAKELKLIKTEKSDWKTAIELTQTLAHFDPIDPVKYDFALFGLGVNSKLH